MTLGNTVLIHFNDVYNVEKSPRFIHRVKATRSNCRSLGRSTLTVFSGDCFSPSIMSTILGGEQMAPALNLLDIDVACLGNHDLDFGISKFKYLVKKCNFPWLCSNAREIGTGDQLAGCCEYIVLDKREEGGAKLLFIGLVEHGWLDTLASVEPSQLMFEDPIDYIKRRVPELKEKYQDIDGVVAVTHQRMPNDVALALNGKPHIDIILGGHDHHYEDRVDENIRILNSGCDFKSFTVVNIEGKHADGGFRTSTERIDISPDDEQDVEAIREIEQYKRLVDESMDIIVGKTKVPLDARFSEIRTKETNVSNFLAELMARGTGADVAILNAGTIRADRFIDKGQLTERDLCDLLPMADPTSVISLTGDKLLAALENGVSKYPAMEGRFPCVDGVRFRFDPSLPPGSRIIKDSVLVRSKPKSQHGAVPTEGNTDGSEEGIDDRVHFAPLCLTKTYSVVSKAYLIGGKDGFDAFVGAPVLMDDEQCPTLPTLLRNIFTQLRLLKRWKSLTTSEETVLKAATVLKRIARRSDADLYAISPQVDGRISMIQD